MRRRWPTSRGTPGAAATPSALGASGGSASRGQSSAAATTIAATIHAPAIQRPDQAARSAGGDAPSRASTRARWSFWSGPSDAASVNSRSALSSASLRAASSWRTSQPRPKRRRALPDRPGQRERSRDGQGDRRCRAADPVSDRGCRQHDRQAERDVVEPAAHACRACPSMGERLAAHGAGARRRRVANQRSSRNRTASATASHGWRSRGASMALAFVATRSGA